ncbi:MAG: LamG-like jellyroll fold domain-containing protein, partial [Bacteroidia bacterium]
GWGNWGSVSQTNALRLNGATSVVNYWWNNDLTITCPNLADGFWHHIAATFDGTIRAIYVDGVKMGQDLPSGHNVPFSNNMRIGSTNNSEYFSGPIDDVRIWTIARTSDDIAGNMNNCLSGSEAGLVALYNMNNGPGSSTVSDLTSNANNGTLVNMNTTTDWVTGYNNCNVNYLWSPTAATTQSVIVTPAVSTVYTVNVTSFVGCSKAAVTSVTVNATPTLAISGSTAVCAGNSAVLTGSGANTYTWSTSANTTTISVSPAVPTTYSVTGTSSAGCTSSASATKTVSVNALPTLSISSSGTVVCSGQTASLTGSGANTYTWSTSANTSTISVSPTVTTTYSVNGTNAAGCTSSVSAVQTVSVNALPALSVSSSSTLLCSGQTASLTANGAGTYTWSTGANTSSITVTPSVTTSYTVSGTNSAGCSDVSVLTQSVSTCTGIEQADAAAGMSVYPNPNNGSFSVYIAAPLENGELLILNAIGQNVYRQVILQGTNTIRISDLTKGLYHYQVLRNKQVTGMGKLIVE